MSQSKRHVRRIDDKTKSERVYGGSRDEKEMPLLWVPEKNWGSQAPSLAVESHNVEPAVLVDENTPPALCP